MVRLGALGDVVDALPALTALRLREPGLHITFLTKAPFAALVSMVADDVIAYPKNFMGIMRALLRLSRSNFDMVLDFQGNLRSALLGTLPFSRQHMGFSEGVSREGAWRLYSHPHSPAEAVRSRIDRGLSLMSKAIGEPLSFARPQLSISEMHSRRANTLVSGGFDIALVLGTSAKGRYKSWPADRWVRFVKQANAQWRFLLVKGPGDSLPAELEHHARCRVATCSDPLELMETLRSCRVVMGADTGPMHLAHLLDKPTLVLFGPKDPAMYGPQYNAHRVIWHRQSCGPCRNWRCDHVSCMWAISTEEAASALAELLEAS